MKLFRINKNGCFKEDQLKRRVHILGEDFDDKTSLKNRIDSFNETYNKDNFVPWKYRLPQVLVETILEAWPEFFDGFEVEIIDDNQLVEPRRVTGYLVPNARLSTAGNIQLYHSKTYSIGKLTE